MFTACSLFFFVGFVSTLGIHGIHGGQSQLILTVILNFFVGFLPHWAGKFLVVLNLVLVLMAVSPSQSISVLLRCSL